MSMGLSLKASGRRRTAGSSSMVGFPRSRLYSFTPLPSSQATARRESHFTLLADFLELGEVGAGHFRAFEFRLLHDPAGGVEIGSVSIFPSARVLPGAGEVVARQVEVLLLELRRLVGFRPP